jgi:hypothetical protein
VMQTLIFEELGIDEGFNIQNEQLRTSCSLSYNESATFSRAYHFRLLISLLKAPNFKKPSRIPKQRFPRQNHRSSFRNQNHQTPKSESQPTSTMPTLLKALRRKLSTTTTSEKSKRATKINANKEKLTNMKRTCKHWEEWDAKDDKAMLCEHCLETECTWECELCRIKLCDRCRGDVLEEPMGRRWQGGFD